MMFAALSIKEWTAIIVLATFALYIGIAWWSRAGSTGEFYVAAKSVSPWANGAEFCRGDHCQSVDSAAAGEDPGSGGGHPHTAGVGRTRSSRGCEYRPIDRLLVDVFTGVHVLCGAGLVVDGFPLDFEIDGQTVHEALEFQFGLEIG